MPIPISELTSDEIINMTAEEIKKYTPMQQMWIGSQKHFHNMSYKSPDSSENSTPQPHPTLTRMDAMHPKRTWREFFGFGKGKRKSRRSSNSRVHSRVHSRSKKSTRRRRKA